MKSFVTLFALIAVAAATCPPLWTSGGRSCYRYFRTPATIDQAINFCMDYGNCDGEMAQVVQIESHRETILLQKYMNMFVSEQQRQPPSFWLNLRLQQVRDPTTGANNAWWMWGDGTKIGNAGQQPGAGVTPVPPVPPYTNFGVSSTVLPSIGTGQCVYTALQNTVGLIWKPTACNIRAGILCEMPSGDRRPVGPRRRPVAIQ
ncbi:uncharacterized protein [Antedon mediterranea]|uniref:uncharacterized protein n=1 Tax=Antedon mediterranea TaxID=105859 RepID=UPI003AF6F9C6